MNKPLLFPYAESLTSEEEKARDIMVYTFNPVLKMLLNQFNPKEFYQYGYNSCRQTAILGGYFLRSLLPDYTITVYEGQFTEPINDVITPYIHAFIIAQKGNRNLIIDLSRTSKRLLFHPVFNRLYPEELDYKNVVYINKERLDYVALTETEEKEYLTGLKPLTLLSLISSLMTEVAKKTNEEQRIFWESIYRQFTQIEIKEVLPCQRI